MVEERHSSFYACCQCGGHGSDVVVYDDVWHAAWHHEENECGKKFLCRKCIEVNIGRELTTDDMPACGMNICHFIAEGWSKQQFLQRAYDECVQERAAGYKEAWPPTKWRAAQSVIWDEKSRSAS